MRAKDPVKELHELRYSKASFQEPNRAGDAPSYRGPLIRQMFI